MKLAFDPQISQLGRFMGREQSMLDCGQTAACKTASVRAYNELRTRGILDRDAFKAAVRVFRHHHPDTPFNEANFAVAEWLAPETAEAFQ